MTDSDDIIYVQGKCNIFTYHTHMTKGTGFRKTSIYFVCEYYLPTTRKIIYQEIKMKEEFE